MSKDLVDALDRAVLLKDALGYLNFSEGRPEPRFAQRLNEAYEFVAEYRPTPWELVRDALASRLEALHGEALAKEKGAFRDVQQARAVLALAFEHLLPAYRDFHADLLGHCDGADLFQPFFLVRACEAVLMQRGPWDETERIVEGALRQLNDYVGHRPIATLETRPRGEPYPHERFRPVPLYLRGAGVAWGHYRALVQQALDILNRTDSSILQEASFDPALLDELALDVRAYDFNHPADKRPNYCFGEWDPHHIDNQGRYRRYVVRQIVLDALLDYAHGGPRETFGQGIGGVGRSAPSAESASSAQSSVDTAHDSPLAASEDRLWEAGAVLAGTILMGAGVSGWGPEAHDSSVTLASLVPRIARYRETFYGNLLASRTGAHGQHLQRDAERTKQPFGGIRQRLNQFMAGQRALQLQQRRLALLFARIGYPEASRRQAAQITVASTRFLTEMHLRLTRGQLLLERGEVAAAATLLGEIEDLLQRGIGCGALVDPWNILGFQAQYPRFTALPDSVRDQRIDDLIDVVGGLFTLYARVLSEGAATGKPAGERGASAQVLAEMKRLADWWDRFATDTVGDVPKVHGGQAVESAKHVAEALAHWRQRGEATGDLAFWRGHLEGFQTPKAFAAVVDALLRKNDYRAAMALLMTWLGQRDQVPLHEDDHSFHALALRWMLGVCAQAKDNEGAPLELISKFFDYLEANAEDEWEVPELERLPQASAARSAGEEEDESPYGAAYEGVTYKDSTDDDVESEVLDIMPQKDFDLTAEAQRLEPRIQFLSTLARLWTIATRGALAGQQAAEADARQTLGAWLKRARHNFGGLRQLLDRVHEHEVPRPSGSGESLVEFNRRRILKERLTAGLLGTCLETALAAGAIQGILGVVANPIAEQLGWEPYVVRIEQALWRGDAETVRQELPAFVETFRQEPLVYVRLEHGGHPRQILRAGLAQMILRVLAANLPRLGLLRETVDLVRTAKVMEDQQALDGPRTTEFAQLFQLGCQALLEAVVDSARSQEQAPPAPEEMVGVLEAGVEPLLLVWIQHSDGVRLSTLETITSKEEWTQLVGFIKRYGGDLFQPRFMTLPNLNGVLHQGVGRYLDYLRDNADPLHPVRLIDELDAQMPRTEAERWLQCILQTVTENYAEYQDYKATTTQSDYGENLHQLLDMLRLKTSYDRNVWKLRPLYQVHEVLARRLPEAAAAWRTQVQEFTRRLADEHHEELERLQAEYGMRLPTIADRVGERFIKTLQIDRVVALVEPAMDSARAGSESVPLEDALRGLSEHPSGVGMEVPLWLRRLEAEAERVAQSRTAIAGLVESVFQIPRVVVPWPRLLEQLRHSEKEV